MATLGSCIKKSSLKNKFTEDQLKSEQLSHVDSVLNELRTERQRYVAKAPELFMSLATKLTQEDLHDPDNRLSKFVSKPKQSGKIFQKTKDSIKGLLGQENIGSKPTSKDDLNVLKEIHTFIPNFIKKGLDATYWAKNINQLDYRFQDYSQYLTDFTSGKEIKGKATPELNPKVKQAIALVVYKYLATEGKATLFNTEDDVRGILALSSGATVPSAAKNALATVGTNANHLSETLGRPIADLLGIKASDDAHPMDEERLMKALGMQAILAMEELGYLDRTTVYVGTEQDSKKGIKPTGLLGLKDNVETDFLAQEDSLGRKGSKGKSITTFFRVKSQKQTYDKSQIQLDSKATYDRVHKDIGQLTKSFAESPHTWDLLLHGEKDKDQYSFDKPKDVKGFTQLKRTSFKATGFQSNNLNNYEQQAWTINHPMTNLYYLLGDMRAKVVGQIEDGQDLDIRQESIKGINQGLVAEHQALNEYILQAKKQPKGLSAQFWIGGEFWKNSRMGMKGSLNPQQSKVHRWLFGKVGWSTTFNFEDTKANDTFLKAIGVGLGIESGKVGGPTSAIKATQALLETEIYADAVQAIQRLSFGRNFDELGAVDILALQEEYQEDITTIVKAVEKGGKKLHTLKVLTEYARFLNADGGEFTTDLVVEIDGVTNGVIIGTWQMLTDEAIGLDPETGIADPKIIAQTLSVLSNGGASFVEGEAALDERLSDPKTLDAYKGMGHELVLQLQKHKEDLIETMRSGDVVEQGEARTAMAKMQAVIGLTNKAYVDTEGYVASFVRKLAKSPTMTTFYGVGPTALNMAFVDDFINTNIYDALTKAITKEDSDAVDLIMTDVHKLLSTEYKGLKYLGFNDDAGQFDIKKVRGFKLSPNEIVEITKHFKANEGAALYKATEALYGSFMKARTSINDASKLMTALYNSSLQKLINEALAGKNLTPKEKKNFIDPITQLTIGELKAIEKKLEGMYPYAPSAFKSSSTNVTVGRVPIGKKDKRKLNIGEEAGSEVLVSPLSSSSVAAVKGHTKFDNFLKDPGVGAMVLLTHMQDAAIANRTIGAATQKALDLLNVHDGFFANVRQEHDTNQRLNEVFTDVIGSYDLASGVLEALVDVGKQFNTHTSDVDPVTIKAFKDLGLIAKNNSRAERQKPKTPREAITQIYNQLKPVADQTARNKKIILAAVIYLSQYSDGTKGFKTGNTQAATIFGFNPEDLSGAASKSVDSKAEAIVKTSEAIVKAGFKSSNEDYQIPTDPAEYSQSSPVNKDNLVQVYDQTKNDSIVKDSLSHDNHLKGLLTRMVSKVMNPIELYMADNPDLETQGVYVADEGGRVFLSNQKTQSKIIGPLSSILVSGLRMSTGEVYAHELIHKITQASLRANPYLKAQAQALYELAESQLTWKVMLNDPNVGITDPFYSAEVKEAKARWDKIFNPKEGDHTFQEENTTTKKTRTKQDSHALDEFIAIGLTNENFYKALATVALTKDTRKSIRQSFLELKGKNGQETILNLFKKIMDFISFKFTSREPQENVASELEALALALGQADSENKSRLDRIFTLAETHTKIAATYANAGLRAVPEFVGKTQAWADVKTAVSTVDAQVKDINNPLGQKYRELRFMQDSMDRGLINAAFDELKGMTERIKPFHRLNTVRNLVLDGNRNTASEMMRMNLKESYAKIEEQLGHDLTDEQRTMITKVLLRTDLSHLHSTMSMDDIKLLVQSDTALASQIQSLETQFTSNLELRPFRHYFHKASKALGYFMVHSKGISDKVTTFQNATVIANMFNTANDRGLSNESISKAESIVDELVVLYALQNSSKQHRNDLVSFMDMDMDAIENTMIQHTQLKANALRELFNGNKMQFIKGYTKQRFNPHNNVAFGEASDREAFEQQGYLKSYPIKRDSSDPQRDILMYTNALGSLNDYQAGIAATISNISKGSDHYDQHTQLDGLLDGSVEKSAFLKKKDIINERMFDPGTVNPDNTNAMIPVVDEHGNIAKYRYMMSEQTKDGVLGQDNAFDGVLGGMAGQLIEKSVSPEINENLIDALKTLFDNTFQDNPELFVEISPYSAHERHRSIYYKLPREAKQHLKNVWGTDKMYVPRDIVDIAFGYRKYSIVESFQKTPQERNKYEKVFVNVMNLAYGTEGIVKARTMEAWMQEITGMAKNSIVVKNVGVSGGNFESNMMFLKNKGLTNREMFKWVKQATEFGLRYQADSKQLASLEFDKENIANKHISQVQKDKQLKNIDRKILEVESKLSNNPASLLIESGIMPSLVDDVETDLTSTAFPGEPEKQIQEVVEKLPQWMQDSGRALFLTDDQASYKMLNNAVKMTDYVARYALYQNYTQNDGMQHEDAMALVGEEFINFDTPTHKTLQYLNDVGMVWFSKYQLRVLKQIKNLVVDAPFTTIATFVIGSSVGFGNNVLRSIPLVTKGALTAFSTPFFALYGSVDNIITAEIADEIIHLGD